MPAETSTSQAKASSTSAAKSVSQTLMPSITKALDDFTTHAAALPPKSDLAFHRTLDRSFAKGLDTTSKRVLLLTEKLLQVAEGAGSSAGGAGAKRKEAGVARALRAKVKPRAKLEDEEDVIDGYRRNVVDVVDALLEDADSKLDDLKGEKRKAAIEVDPKAVAEAGKMLPGPYGRKALGSLPQDIMNADVPKPQIHFADGIDNALDAAPWAPSLPLKHHAMVPMEYEPSIPDEPESSESGPSDPLVALRRAAEQRRMRHPYWYETQHLPYPTSMFVPSKPVRPASFDDTPLTWVDTPEELDKLVEKLKAAKEIAIDLEHHSMRSYGGFTCLMQISDREQDWIVDTIKLRQELRESKLGGVLADPSIIKVFHGSDSDIVWLQQDFDLYVVNLFDTYHATVILGYQSHSLASLLARFCDYSADKRYQLADWRIRPLTDEMMRYARADTHFLLYIYDNLRNALLDKSSRPSTPVPEGAEMPMLTVQQKEERRNPQADMREVLERSAETALKLYERKTYREDGRGSEGWKGHQQRFLPAYLHWAESGHVFRKLHKWRDQCARAEDESVYYIMPNEVLRQLSTLPVTSLAHVQRVLNNKPIVASRFATDIYQVILDAKQEWPSIKADVINNGVAARGEARQAQQAAVPPEPPAAATSGVPETTIGIGGAQQVGQSQSVQTPPAGGATIASDDLWAPRTETRPEAAKSRSSLFGNTMTKPSQSTPNKSIAKSASSALFGKALPKKQGSPSNDSVQTRQGFKDVMSEIVADFAPRAAPVEPQPATGSALPEPETVPFIPAGQRAKPDSEADNKWSSTKAVKSETEQKPTPTPTPAFATSAPVAGSASKAETEKKPASATFGDIEVVSVKRKKPKKRQLQALEAATASPEKKQRLSSDEPGAEASQAVADGSDAEIAVVEGQSPRPRRLSWAERLDAKRAAAAEAQAKQAKKDAKRAKKAAAAGGSSKVAAPRPPIRPEDIPEFDYSKETNLLDNPNSMTVEERRAAKSKKAAKKEKKARGPPPLEIETPKFGKSTPKDRSQPRQGNISRTFAS